MSCPANALFGDEHPVSTAALRVLDPPVGSDDHRPDALEALYADMADLPLEVGSSPMLTLILETELGQPA